MNNSCQSISSTFNIRNFKIITPDNHKNQKIRLIDIIIKLILQIGVIQKKS